MPVTNLIIKNKKASRFFLKLLFLSIFYFLLFSCKTLPQEVYSVLPQEQSWKELESGVEFIEQTLPSSRYILIKIDLTNPDISIDTNQIDEKYFNGKFISTFAKKEQSYITINGTPFSFPLSKLIPKYKLVGIHIKNGKVLSPANDKYGAICFTEDQKAIIINSQSEIENISNVKTAIGGFWTILENDTIFSFKPYRDSRMVVGVNKKGTKLFILGVEKTKSEGGLTYMECAEILKEAGAVKALQLDGGGSTGLYTIQGNNLLIKPKRPIPNVLYIFVSN
jgi:hypothetical protein